MFTIWFIGFIGIILYRAFNAGMNSADLFFREKKYSFESKDELYLDEGQIMSYIIYTLLASVTWPLVLPVYGVYKLGVRRSKFLLVKSGKK